jgi:hypothetical protein
MPRAAKKITRLGHRSTGTGKPWMPGLTPQQIQIGIEITAHNVTRELSKEGDLLSPQAFAGELLRRVAKRASLPESAIKLDMQAEYKSYAIKMYELANDVEVVMVFTEKGLLTEDMREWIIEPTPFGFNKWMPFGVEIPDSVQPGDRIILQRRAGRCTYARLAARQALGVPKWMCAIGSALGFRRV